jgi:hypothetical protein
VAGCARRVFETHMMCARLRRESERLAALSFGNKK